MLVRAISLFITLSLHEVIHQNNSIDTLPNGTYNERLNDQNPYIHVLLHHPPSPKFTAHYLTSSPHHLRLPQNPQLPITRRITRHIQPSRRVPSQPRRPKASRAKTRSIPLTALDLRIIKDILRRRGTRQGLHRRILPIRAKLKVHRHKLEPRDRRPIPRPMVRDIHRLTLAIKLAINRRRVREQRQLGGRGFLHAGIVAHGGGGGLDEEIPDFEGLVGEVGGVPDGEAGGVAVPVVVGLRDVAHVVDLFAGVVHVHVFAVALEVVAGVFDAP